MTAATLSPSDDSDLVAAARAGEAWALTELWQRHAPAVLGYLRGRGVADAEDVTSDVFLGVFERLPSFRGGESDLRALVFTVAHHKMVDEVRRRARRGDPLPYDDEADRRVVPSAETDALASLSDERVLRLLDDLSPDQREVVLLRIVADLSLEQTAQILGKRVNAVKALQHRGIAALRRALEPAVTP